MSRSAESNRRTGHLAAGGLGVLVTTLAAVMLFLGGSPWVEARSPGDVDPSGGAGAVPSSGGEPDFFYGSRPQATGSGLQAPRQIRDIDGEPIPFESEEDLLEFLRTAEVVSMEPIPEGVTEPDKVLLEKDGVRLHAVFRDVAVRRTRANLEGRRTAFFFRDEALFECAAYELARLLGLGAVPPVVERRIGRSSGTLQVWIEGAMTESERVRQGLRDPSRQRWNRQLRTMNVFDRLIGNTDRNRGNMLIDDRWQIWFIDHTRAFTVDSRMAGLERITEIERGLWEALQGLSPELVEERLDAYLTGPELSALLRRHERLVEHFEKLIAERGEDRVLY